MNRPKLVVPRTLSFVVVAAATFAGPWIACDSSTSSGTTSGGGNGGTTTTSDARLCVPAADAGPNQKCPDMLDAGEMCPPGCQVEVV
jgi:hypothetical protein